MLPGFELGGPGILADLGGALGGKRRGADHDNAQYHPPAGGGRILPVAEGADGEGKGQEPDGEGADTGAAIAEIKKAGSGNNLE